MLFKDLYALVVERRLAFRKKGVTKEVLQQVLREADAAAAAGSAAAAPQKPASRLASLLDPQGAKEDWMARADKAEGGADVTPMFLDVNQGGANHKENQAAVFEEASTNGVIPSVAVDKFLVACNLHDVDLLGVLFGSQKAFGKGKGRYHRTVVSNMVLGRCSQLSQDAQLSKHTGLCFAVALVVHVGVKTECSPHKPIL